MIRTNYNNTSFKNFSNFIAGGLLVLMFLLGFFSMKGDSATMDELAHTPAGYSYVSQLDMRLNPEHPPLLKDLAGLSVWLGSKITNTPVNFPENVKSWQEDVNGQWDFGRELFYKSGNDADNIILWSRLPMLLIMIVLGIYVFKWTRELYGQRAGLLALFLYSLSPTFLAHGRLVTTDVGAAAAFFIATYYLVSWLKERTTENLIVAGLVFGLALLTKFSLFLLTPYFVFLTIAWVIVKKDWSKGLKDILPGLTKSLLGLFLIGIIAMALVWPVYQVHVINYPAEKQQADSASILSSFGTRWLADTVVWMADKPILRPYGQFFLGLLMVMQRAVGGNTTYFLGEMSASSWLHYFPVVFLIKAPLAFLLLGIIALIYSLLRISRPVWEKPFSRIFKWVKDHFAEFALISFFIIYWASTLKTNLNIGVRHILPTLPVLYVLISGQISHWLRFPIKSILEKQKTNIIETLKNIKDLIVLSFKTYFKYLMLILLLIWYAGGIFQVYPHFLAYFNELVGGPQNGYIYVTDSNLDWGQELKRLNQFVEKNNIGEIYVDYFGGGSVQYYLGGKFKSWWGTRDPKDIPQNGWLAVSATFLQGGRGLPVPGFKEPTGYYGWLFKYEPVAVIGHSIFVYQITTSPDDCIR